MRDFADKHLRRLEPHWRPSGRRTMRIYLKARVLPAFGRMPLNRIGPEDVAAWLDAAREEKPGAANCALEILRAMMFRAEEWRLRERRSNPRLGFAKNPRTIVARFLDVDELARLGHALYAQEARWLEAVAAIRLLALTGCRRGKVLNLRWRDIGEDATNPADSNAGPRDVPFGEAARAIIEILPGPGKPEGFLFPSFAHGQIRAVRKIAADGPLACEESCRFLVAASLSAAMVKNDDQGSVRLVKQGDQQHRTG